MPQEVTFRTVRGTGEEVATITADTTMRAKELICEVSNVNELFEEVRWTSATLYKTDNGAYLDVQGWQNGEPRRLFVTPFNAGFAGSGATDAASALSFLGFGQKEEILRQLVIPRESYDFRAPGNTP